MPHLSEMQARYAKDGVTVIGATKPDSSNTLDAVRKMTESMGDRMAYTVGWDAEGKTYASYMDASGQSGIPTSFLVDRQGRIAFIGHPSMMDLPLARVVNPAAQVVGVSINTAAMGEDEAMSYLEAVEKRMGLPTVDPFRQGADRLVDALDGI